jgi:hypothetical protein
VHIPEWLIGGVLLGVLGSIVVAVLFVAANRLFPDTEQVQLGDGGESRRRAEMREYLSAIDERFTENHSVDGQSVAFYLPAHDVAITFDPRAYFALEQSRTNAVLVEHELPGIHIGQRLPFETPDVSFETGPDLEDSPQDAFAELGLPRNATLPEIKSAYRERVKQVHPDHGGDEDEFKRVQEAYTLAKQHAD